MAPPNPAHSTPIAPSYPLNSNNCPILPSVEQTETPIKLLALTFFHNTILLMLQIKTPAHQQELEQQRPR